MAAIAVDKHPSVLCFAIQNRQNAGHFDVWVLHVPQPDVSSANVLVINCGSSSIKYAVIPAHAQARAERIEGIAEQLGGDQARIRGRDAHGAAFDEIHAGADHTTALQVILHKLAPLPLAAIGHRVVHGGVAFTQATRIDDAVLVGIEQVSPLAPLHNPANLIGIRATRLLFADLPQVAVFDTAFHQSMPEVAYRYALPERLYQDCAIRRYGFHGTSHAHVSERAGRLTGGAGPQGWLTAHLGNGCSATAVWDGRSVDTSMGLTPLEGLVMGTRSGDVDPGLHAHLQRTLGWSLDEIDRMLNRDSGLLGLSGGLSNDMRTLTEAADAGHAGALLAIEVFCYRLAKTLSALSVALPELTGLVFTGGIGENAAVIRAKTVARLHHLGLTLDADTNRQAPRGQEARISAPAGRAIWVIPTDEEGRIAAETRAVLFGALRWFNRV